MFGIRTRFTVAAAVAALALSGCTSTDTNAARAVSTTKAAPTSPLKSTPAPKASQGFGSKAASGDVKLGALRVDAKLGTSLAEVTITNHSAQRSNYIVDLSITSANGKTKFDAAMVSAQGLAPGQAAKRTAHFMTTQRLPIGATLTIVGIARLVA